MADTTTEMLKIAQTLDKSILDAVLDGNRKWITKNQKLNKAHKSLHEVIETLIELATEENEPVKLSGAEEEAFQYRGVKL